MEYYTIVTRRIWHLVCEKEVSQFGKFDYLLLHHFVLDLIRRYQVPKNFQKDVYYSIMRRWLKRPLRREELRLMYGFKKTEASKTVSPQAGRNQAAH